MSSISVGDVGVNLLLNRKAYDADVKNTLKSTENSFKSSMKKVGAIIASAFAVKEVVNFSKSAVNAASEVQSAWTGLNSIVQGTGNSFKVAQDFITDYTKDGLVSVNEAVTSYKNLLSRGYDTSQIEGTLNALKDSASFGRQANYDLGEAVVTATEGLKNENSILVDNAGVTKNVAKMWDEYAASIGKTSNNLTQAEKIQAEYKGIMQETKFQTGDAITYANTFSGQVQRLTASFTSLKVAVGKVVTPIAQLFIPVINGAVTALTNFFNSIAKVLKLFGLEFKEVMTKSSAPITNLTNDISGTGDAAVKAAKKVNKAFADVDEIHVLSPSKSASSNDSSSDSGVNVATSIVPTVATDDAVSTAVDGTVSKILKYIEPLKNISFDNLINAFKNLGKALKPFGKKIGSGLEWLYFNVLVPLAKWTIEKVLPSFLNGLSGALGILNSIIEGGKETFLWLWNSFLQPLAGWTADVISNSLEILASGLQTLSDWCNENQEIINNVVKALVIFFGLWKLTELMAFIEIAGGITGAFKLLTSSIWENIAAKIADKADTVILTALYAKDFLMSLVNGTAALVKQAAQWVIITGVKIADTAATTAATAATWLFNTALTVLTSPITLVIAAITALIAIIVLCVKNWNTIKETVISVISSIQDKVSSGFSIMKDVIGNSMTSVKNTISNVWNGIWGIIKGVINSILGGTEAMVNGVIKGFNLMIKAMNKLSFDVPDWVPAIGGKKFGFDLKTINEVSLPRLYQGGYVDRNNPQLAIVGDNTREGEIIAPESKIYDQTDKAIKDNGVVGKQEIELTIYHKYEDGRTIIQKINQAQIDAGEILLLT
ncbi:MAG: hypothetical protein K2M17_02985 [Bacilli bacterium]|nr:hypothetical protein [Bacilli bacterium]